MKQTIYFLIVLFFQTTYSQVTFVVDKFPENISEDTSIYISGDFEGWTGGQESYKLQKVKNTFVITLAEQKGTINFKFTRGSWDTVEKGNKGNDIENRSYIFGKKNDTVRVEILSWDKNNVVYEPTTTDNVFVLSNDFDIPQLSRKRRIWMYLPPNYEAEDQSFPVIYMHDGQNIFDGGSSFSGEWEVDETLNRLYRENNASFIVVGIDNGKDKRLDEYSPWENEKYGGGEGDAYLEFIVETLKPYIDSKYKTLTNKDNTAIVGSSLGGLISHYAALKYPDVFGKVGVFSPAFWFAPEIKEFSKTHGSIQETRMYFLAGGKEGNNTAFQEISQTVIDMDTIINILKSQNFPTKNIKSKVVPEGKHNEELWRNNFEEAILWLYKE